MAARGLGMCPLSGIGGLLTTGVSSKLTGVSSELAGVSSELTGVSSEPKMHFFSKLMGNPLAARILRICGGVAGAPSYSGWLHHHQYTLITDEKQGSAPQALYLYSNNAMLRFCVIV
jgi:hypothetical protein